MEANKPFDIRTLYKSQVQRTDHRQETYDIVVRRVHHRVQTVSLRNETHCVFELPKLIVGMPLYDPFECCGYVIRTLKVEGFYVKYYHPNFLYINWAKDVIEHRVRELNAKEDARKRLEKKKKDDEAKKQTDKLGGGLLNLPTVDLNSLDFQPTGKLFQ
jgi:hypothetical protein